ncbi:MAG: recombinase family protein [Thermodesulfobacteriota bacterium]
MKAVGYIRVSTEEQAREGISLDMQRVKIHTYVELEELEFVDIIEDAGISGYSIKGRPGVQRVLQLIRGRKIDALVIFKLDRLARNTVESSAIATLCQENEISLHSITEKLDTKSAVGKFSFTIMAGLAEMERALIGERIKAVMDLKKERGEVRGHPPFGMKVVDGKLTPDPEEQAVIERILALHAQRLTIYQIVDVLKREGRINRKGRPLAKTQVRSIIQQRKVS